jgi:uncharacterized membrane protein
MRKTILTVLGAALFAAATVQIAAAAEHQRGRKAVRAPVAVSEQVRNANAAAWSYEPAQPTWPGYYYGGYGGGISAPAGH